MLADMLVNFDYDQYFELVLFVYHCVKFYKMTLDCFWCILDVFLPLWFAFCCEIDSINFVSRYFMASNASSGSNIGFTPSKSDDPVWAHCIKVLGKKNQTICLYCNKHIQSGGIRNFKRCWKLLQDTFWCVMANETIAWWFEKRAT